MLLLGNILGAHSWVHIGCMLPHLIPQVWFFIPNFVHHHFWLTLFQECGYLLWFVLISFISCSASQNSTKGPLWSTHHQKKYKFVGMRISDKHRALSNNINDQEPYQFWFCNGMQIHGALFINWPPLNVNFEMGLGKSFKFNSQSC